MRRAVKYGLCFGSCVAFLTAMLVLYITINAPDVASGDDGEELVSPEGRIRIAQVDSYTAFHAPDGQPPEGAKPTLDTIYVPSYLPDGFSHKHTRLLVESSPAQLFESEDTTLTVVQVIRASLSVKTGSAEPIDVNGRSGFLVNGSWIRSEGSATWDPSTAMTILLEMDDAVVSLRGEGSRLTERDMVQIAGSLERSQEVLASLSEDEANPYERVVERMGPGFGPLYVPAYLPEGYSQTRSEARPELGFATTRYRKRCEIIIFQYPLDSPRGPAIVRKVTLGPSKTVVRNGNQIYYGYQTMPHLVRGVQFYLSDPHPGISSEYWFEHEGTWLNIKVSNHQKCETLGPDEVAKIASSLSPVEYWIKPE